jgi:hypothetical protein
LIEPWRKYVKDGKVKALVPLPTITGGTAHEEHEVMLYIFTDLLLVSKPNGKYLGHIYLAETWLKDSEDIEGSVNAKSLCFDRDPLYF